MEICAILRSRRRLGHNQWNFFGYSSRTVVSKTGFQPKRPRLPHNLGYKGRVVKLLPGMAAAFVDVGLERPAYLFAEDVSAQEDEFYHLTVQELRK